MFNRASSVVLAGVVAGIAAIANAQPQGAGAVEPPWPVKFSLSAGEATGFGFIVGQPGPVHITLQCQGAPVAVIVIRSGGAPATTGSCAAPIDVSATAADVQRGVIWGVLLRTQGGAADLGSSVRGRPARGVLPPVVSGSVAVQHPPADLARANAELSALVARAPKPTPLPAGTKVVAVPAAEERTAEIERDNAARRAAMKSKLATPAAPPAAPATAPALERVTRAAGSVQPPPASPIPVITSMSSQEGQPVDPIRLTGSNFGTTKGEVRVVFPPGFLIPTTREVVAPVDTWTDTAIDFAVPFYGGIVESPVQVYVMRPGVGNSKPVTFKFKPSMETRVIQLSVHSTLPYTSTGPSWGAWDNYITYGSNWLLGAKGDDDFYFGMPLKNGWVVDDAYIVSLADGSQRTEKRGPAVDGMWVNQDPKGDAYITESHLGTNNPAMKVHWWLEPHTMLRYGPRVLIRGPLGVPHQ